MRSLVTLTTTFLLITAVVAWSPERINAQDTTIADNSDANSDESLTNKLLRLQAARQELDEGVRDVVATGSIMRSLTVDGDLTTQAFDLHIITRGEKFSVQLVEKVPRDLLSMSVEADETDVPVEAIRRSLKTHVVLFDGDSVYSVEISNAGCQGKVQFGFQQKAALRSAGYPYSPPLQLWQAYGVPLTASDVALQPLNDQRYVLQQATSSYSAKYYIFGDFDYDVRRIAFTATGATRPFREVSYEWSTAGTMRYVARLSVRERRMEADDAATSSFDVNEVIVEFDSFQVKMGDEIRDDQVDFKLADLAIPVGTIFDDHRENVDGKPVQKVWDGESLRPNE